MDTIRQTIIQVVAPYGATEGQYGQVIDQVVRALEQRELLIADRIRETAATHNAPATLVEDVLRDSGLVIAPTRALYPIPEGGGNLDQDRLRQAIEAAEKLTAELRNEFGL